MKTKPVSGPHSGAGGKVSSIMLEVIAAVFPATAFGIYLFGWPALNLFIVTVLSAVIFEYFCLRLAGKKTGVLKDGSAVLTGWLLAMTLPPWAPWWIGFVGAGIA
ncbi:MAG: RnfABCDGE type electron transport complex subunit D, partial [Gammaproteobacteria bacterium]